MTRQWYAASDLAGLPGMPGTERGVNKQGERGELVRRKRSQGKGWEYSWRSLPNKTQAALLRAHGAPAPAAPTAPLPVADNTPAGHQYNAETLWEWARTRSQALRDQGAQRAALLAQVLRLVDAGRTMTEALQAVGTAHAVSPATLRGWYYGTRGRPGAQHYAVQDWSAALIPGYVGRTALVEIPAPAWDWFCSYYLTRKPPTLAEAYRRTEETARAHGWGALPSEKTFERRIKSEFSQATRVYLREGAEALAKLYPYQRRDTTVFAAGEAVVGDGLKFDRLYVRWPDGEVLNTSTGWFWADLRTGYIAAYRLAKTENTDLFRLATYDLTGKFKPDYAWVDNTVVAANKAMTGRAQGRHRFHDRENDPIGLLLQIGIDVRFTNPDRVLGSPGAKPIERSFGTGGLHDKVATHPDFLDRGYSRATAIPYEEFARVVAIEVERFNRQPKRRSAVCRGVLSFEEAFRESFSQATVKRLTEAQRSLLLLMPEVVRADRARGEIRLKAGRGPHGQHRYWTEALAEYKAQQLVAYYDPAELTQPVTVYTLDGRFIARAEHLGDVGFNDTQTGREWGKNKARYVKARKLAATAERRMTDLEVAALYPQPENTQPPEPGVVHPNFGQRRRVVNGDLVADAPPHEPPPAGSGEVAEYEDYFQRAVGGALKKLREDAL